MTIMTEKYIAVYLLATALFSYIVAFYMKKRFPQDDEYHKNLDEQKLRALQNTKIQRFLALVSLYRYNRLAITLFVFCFNVAIPFFGYIFTIWISWYLVNVKYGKKVVLTNILDLNEFKKTFLKVERVFGEGSMINLLNNIYVPKSKKLRALAILASSPSPASLEIIKQTLSSTDDEIRLYGYSILNNIEKKINSKINKNLQIVQEKFHKNMSEKDKEIVAGAFTALAFSYWELVYMELSHESLKNNFLNFAIKHIGSAKALYLEKIESCKEELMEAKGSLWAQEPKIKKIQEVLNEYYEKLSSLYTLQGRILLHRKKYLEAQVELTVAKELLPEHATSIIPYLAEIYYSVGKYNISKAILNRYDSLRFNATLYPIIKQWEGQSNG
jgi:hypothetical protein